MIFKLIYRYDKFYMYLLGPPLASTTVAIRMGIDWYSYTNYGKIKNRILDVLSHNMP